MKGIIRNDNIKGTIIQKSINVVTYADDISVIARDRDRLEETV